MDKLQQLLEMVTKEEDRYYDLAAKALDKNNMFGNMICTAQAGVFQRIRYTIEDMLQKEE